MFLKKLQSLILRLVVYAVLFLMVLTVFPGIPPYIPFKSIKVTPALPLEGKLAPNNLLDKAILVVDGEVFGAESIVFDGKKAYTGIKGGYIACLEEKHGHSEISIVTQVGKDCEGQHDEHVCGRPLGMRLYTNGTLAVADGYNGILNVDQKTGKVSSFFSMNEPIDEILPMLPNDLDVGRDGSIYWSDLSTNFRIHEFSPERIGDASGRLIRFDARTQKNSVLISTMMAPNGVQLSEDEDFVLVAELFKSRVLRYYLKGPKAGTKDIFVDGLPGLPDNIRPNGRGGFYIAMPVTRVPLIDHLGRLPQVRKIIFRLRWIALTALSIFDVLNLQNPYIQDLQAYIVAVGPLGINFSSKPIIVEVDGEGHIVGSLQSQNSKIHGISQMTVSKDFAYLGTYATPHIWKLKTTDLPQN